MLPARGAGVPREYLTDSEVFWGGDSLKLDSEILLHIGHGHRIGRLGPGWGPWPVERGRLEQRAVIPGQRKVVATDRGAES